MDIENAKLEELSKFANDIQEERNNIDAFQVNPIISGYFYIRFSNIKVFSNGNRVIEYIATELMKKHSWKIKEYQNKDKFIDPLDNEKLYYIKSHIIRDIYKDKYTEEFIDNGVYIDISYPIKVEEKDVSYMSEWKKNIVERRIKEGERY